MIHKTFKLIWLPIIPSVIPTPDSTVFSSDRLNVRLYKYSFKFLVLSLPYVKHKNFVLHITGVEYCLLVSLKQCLELN